METQEIIRILREVPETRLRILDLCRKVIREDGTIDAEKVAFNSLELEEAAKEAQSYSEGTQEAVRCLKELARS
jgi:hypothetical protein